MSSGETEVRQKIRAWIAERAARGEDVGLDDRTPLLEDGWLTSLDVVELILFMEELRGQEIDVESVEPECLSSVDSIYNGFFKAA